MLHPARVFPQNLQSAFAMLFITLIFYGDVYIGITVPAAMFLLPALGLVALWTTGPKILTLRPATCLLLGLLCVPLVQYAFGKPPSRFDIGSYLPIFYAAVVYQIFSVQKTASKHIKTAIFAGAILLSGMTIWSIAYVAPDKYYIPGQDPAMTERRYLDSHRPQTQSISAVETNLNISQPKGQTELIDAQAEAAPRAISGGSTIKDVSDQRTLEFYRYKQTVKSPLGTSNYLAVFFLLAFSVALFVRFYVFAALCAAMVTATMSRFGIAFLAITIGCFILSVLWAAGRIKTILGLVAAGLILLALGSYVLGLHELGFQSIVARQEIAVSSLGVIANSPILGLPRSVIVSEFAYPANWHPHSFVLWVLSFSGVVGLFVYCIYLATIGYHFWRLRDQPFWQGVVVGFITLLLWGNFEIIFLTPAVDILLAALGGAAYTIVRDEDVRRVSDTTAVAQSR